MLSHVSPGWLDYKWFSFSSIYHSTVSHFLQWICITFIIKKCGCCLIQSDRKSKLVAQLGLTLFDPVDCSPPGSSVHGILQARILERVAIPFSGASSQPRDQTQVSCSASGLRLYRQILYYWATKEAPYVSINSEFLIYPTPFPLWHPKVCFLCLWVYFCF